MQIPFGITAPNSEKDDVDKIQIEAARISTGATRLVSIESLYEEIRWETLEKRRQLHKLTLLYKMKEHLLLHTSLTSFHP